MLKLIHAQIFEAASNLIERRPGFGWVFASVSTTGGLIGIVQTATVFVGLMASIVGLIVGVYTLKIQKRVWEQGNKSKDV